MKKLNYDVVIIGSGISGLFGAIEISKRADFKARILIITKCPLAESNSRYAQGGIAALIKQNLSDSAELYINDTLKSGAGLADRKVVQYIVENSQKAIEELVNLKAGFDCDEKGNFSYTLGGAHSVKRVLHSGQDATGMVIMKALSDNVKKAQNIDILDRTMALELVIEDNECKGVIALNKKTNEYVLVNSSRVILASGGACQIYKYTTNPYGATGDGIALAYCAGAKIKDMEFIQFHPTALVLNNESKSRYLISEALRGEGAKLVNSTGVEFMAKYSAKKELSSRDVVTRAIISEMNKENSKNVFLKTSDISADVVLKRFPTIAKKCAMAGIDITRDPIPVAPAAHYMIGGIEVDLSGRTSIKGLYAIGEAASIGFHGANRLASNSLMECAVCAYKLANDIDFIKPSEITNFSFEKYEKIPCTIQNCAELKAELKELMWNSVGIIREEKSLLEARVKIEKLLGDLKEDEIYSTIEEYEYKNMLIASLLVVNCALLRKESRGAHNRCDYPQAQDKIYHTYIKGENYECI